MDDEPNDEPQNTPEPQKITEPGPVISPTPSAVSSATPQPVATPDAGKIKVDAAGYIIKGNKLCMKKGSKTTLKITDITAGGTKGNISAGDITYESSDKKIADISGKGILKIKGTGDAVIKVKVKGNEKASIRIKAVAKDKVNKKLTLTKKTLRLKKGSSAVVGIKKISDGTTSIIKYRSANKKIAKVDAYGVIQAKNKGNTIIHVTCGKKKAAVRVKVS